MAEWLGRGLQNLLQQFESARNLKGITKRNPFIFFMKYSQLIGIGLAIALIAICYLPWIYISSIRITVTGLHSEGTSFGKPGLVNIAFAGLAIIFFSIQKIWSKRTNIFMVTINFAWALRNFLLLGTCQSGDCPEKKVGLYLLLVLSFLMLLMSFLPRISIPEEK